MQPSEADTESAVDLPWQRKEDQQWGFHIGDVVQIGQGFIEKCTYALYYGQGRVIHVWSPSRRQFRVRVDSLRGLNASGYVATICSRELDKFFYELLNIIPLAKPKESIWCATTALHATAASRLSNLCFILFARYGDTIFKLLQLLKEAYSLTFDDWMLGKPSDESLQVDESPLDSPVHLVGHSNKVDVNHQAALSTQPAIKMFFGSVGDLLMSEWLGKLLSDFFKDSRTRSNWYSITMPSVINCLSPLFLQFDIPLKRFQVRYDVARGLPQRMADDRMECGVCWMSFTSVRVMLFKCEHYICAPCLRLLSRQECPYCRGPILNAEPLGECVKREASRLLNKAMEPDRKPGPSLLQ
ncbi:unnamed protein product [Peronospora belbahrii]|uniref:RING-type domain-containing protein n=1 Tax=Peronospora belbahrii TaxID=622444 RepID=A0AAU9L2I7_9STRA|nr:unnamed protein product [Peronospora belbahrii]CAH0521005.1 unnamed protein product [Peronospora belbahrii]